MQQISHTLAWGVPELSPRAAAAVEARSKLEADAADKPANYSLGRWFGHSTLANLVYGLSMVGRHQAESLGLVAGRSDQAIALMLTLSSDGTTTQANVDLINHRNQLHSGDEVARSAFNIGFGMYASRLEAEVLPDKKGIGYAKVWENLPADATIEPIGIESPGQAWDVMEAVGRETYPELLWERMLAQENVLYLVPDRPSMVDGKPRWAWLEFDMETYDVISVSENGQRNAMIEAVVLGALPNNISGYAKFGAGMLVGADAALYTVTAFTLTGMEYEDVLKAAEAECAEIAKVIAVFEGAIGIAGFPSDVGSILLKGTVEDALKKASGALFGQFSFCDGFKLGAAMYFEFAKPMNHLQDYRG